MQSVLYDPAPMWNSDKLAYMYVELFAIHQK